MYKTLGCAHSLQPTPNPYETPSIPCLKPLGYLRWQTIQLQLDPAEHVPFLQKAVSLYDVPKPDGGFFPKHIPSEAFPAQPDKEIEHWWKTVTHQLTQEDQMRRLGTSPYRSPHENGRTEYFTYNGRLSAGQPPHRPSRTNSEDDVNLADARRRSSVPELKFNQNGGGRPESKGKPSRSRSAQRISSGPYYPPPPQQAGPSRHASSNHRHSSGTSSPYPPPSKQSTEASGHRRPRSSGGQSTPRRRHRSPSTIQETSGSEASSEDSRSGRDRKKHDDHRRSSLWPPSFLHHYRRHSHDATYVKPERAPPLPPRPTPIQTHVPRADYKQESPQSASRRRGLSNNVHFRNDMFMQGQAINSAPEMPVAPEYIPPPTQIPKPRARYDPPPQNMHLLQGAPLSRTTSGENSHGGQPTYGPPARAKTVTMGVGGRRYPVGDSRNGVAPSRRKDRTMSAAPVGTQSG